MSSASNILAVIGAAVVLLGLWRSLPRITRNMDGDLLVIWRGRCWSRSRTSGRWEYYGRVL